MMVAARLAAILVVCAVLGGCSGRTVERVEKRLAAAGLHVEGFRKVEPAAMGATACRQGKVERLHAILCSYESARRRTRSTRTVETWVGSALTGAWGESDLGESGDPERFLLLILADRDGLDREGLAIQKVLAAFHDAR